MWRPRIRVGYAYVVAVWWPKTCFKFCDFDRPVCSGVVAVVASHMAMYQYVHDDGIGKVTRLVMVLLNCDASCRSPVRD